MTMALLVDLFGYLSIVIHGLTIVVFLHGLLKSHLLMSSLLSKHRVKRSSSIKRHNDLK